MGGAGYVRDIGTWLAYNVVIIYIELLLDSLLGVQGIGLLAFFTMVLSFQSNVRTTILYTQVLAMGLLGTHLFLLSAFTGAAMMSVLMVRNLVFAQKERFSWASHQYVYFVFLAAVVCAGLLSWEGIGSVFAIAGSLLATYGFWLSDSRKIRLVVLLSAIVWAPYGIIFKSYPMLLLQAFLITSILIAMWRYRKANRTDVRTDT